MLTTSTRVFIDFFFYFPPCLDLSRVIRSSLLFLSAITWQYNVPIYKNKCIFVSYSTKGVFFFFTSGYTQDTGQQCRTMDSRYEFLCVSILTINMNWYCCCCCVVARRFASISIGMRHLSWNTHRFLRTTAFEKKLSSRSFVLWIPFHPLVRITSFGITNRQTFRLSLSSSSPRLFRQLNVFPFRTLRQGAPHFAGFASHFCHALPRRLEVHFQVEDDERIRR